MVAKKIGVKANYIGYLERGMRHPSQKVVERLSSALKLDPQELYLLANPRVRALLGKTKATSVGQSLKSGRIVIDAKTGLSAEAESVTLLRDVARLYLDHLA
jgi:transcriptional regulator with XRE-family HTH domain